VDAGVVLGEGPTEIPVCRDLSEAVAQAGLVPDTYIFGVAPASGVLSTHERGLVLEAIGFGMNVVHGLRVLLSDDPELAAASAARNVKILDVRRPPAEESLRVFSNRIAGVTCPRIAVLGTDRAVGVRTTAIILTRALNERGVKAVMVSTGSTGLMQGVPYGVVLDAIPFPFQSGALEAAIVDAFEAEDPDVIIVEGQGVLGHPDGSIAPVLLQGSSPDGIVLQHAPGRIHRYDSKSTPMPTPASEIDLIEAASGAKVIGLTLSHEKMQDFEIHEAIAVLGCELQIPVADALNGPRERMVEMVLSAFPELANNAEHRCRSTEPPH
jgi:uncharacterized NAD-dependent epimerase/dehydratase family protein